MMHDYEEKTLEPGQPRKRPEGYISSFSSSLRCPMHTRLNSSTSLTHPLYIVNRGRMYRIVQPGHSQLAKLVFRGRF